MPRSLVVGYDGSPCAKAALEVAIMFAERMGDEIVIAFGYDPGGPGEEFKAHREQVREFGVQATAPAIARAREAGVEARLELVPERPVEALISTAEKLDARAIYVGTRGETPLKAAIIGAVPHKLLQIADRPVVVVPADPKLGEPAPKLDER
jgi:nucleotide-binding universal stress UspA family protein